MMKTLQTYLMIALLGLGLSANAQNDREEQIASMRVAFLTKNLNLTPTQAQQFWPIYNAYSSEVEGLQKEERQKFRQLRQQFETISDADAQKVLDRYIAIQSAKINARQQLIQDLKSVLSPKKIIILLRTEEDFKRRILERLGKRRQNLRKQ